MLNFEYIDLPPIPENLYPDIYASFSTPQYNIHSSGYKICNCPTAVYDWVAKVFNPSIYEYDCVNAQEITADMFIHKDWRRKIVYNFILESGNDSVETCFYREKDPATLIERHVIESGRWHRLNVDEWHNAKGLTPGDRRVALCVFKQANRDGDARATHN